MKKATGAEGPPGLDSGVAVYEKMITVALNMLRLVEEQLYQRYKAQRVHYYDAQVADGQMNLVDRRQQQAFEFRYRFEELQEEFEAYKRTHQ
jgi:hypothetical protein